MFTKSILTICLLLTALVGAQKLERPIRFDGQKLVRVAASSKVYTAAQSLHLDVWGKNRKTIDIRVTDAQLSQLKRRLPHSKITVIDGNIQHMIDAETERLNVKLSTKVEPTITADWFTEYHRYADVVAWLKTLAKTYPALVKMQDTIGKSVEGRDIPLIKITSQHGDYSRKKRIWIQG